MTSYPDIRSLEYKDMKIMFTFLPASSCLAHTHKHSTSTFKAFL